MAARALPVSCPPVSPLPAAQKCQVEPQMLPLEVVTCWRRKIAARTSKRTTERTAPNVRTRSRLGVSVTDSVILLVPI
jgi:hypothetical protein